MAKHNAANERIKRDYFHFLAEAKGRDSATIDRVAKSLARFEDSTGHKDFKRFHREQAMAFKRRLGGQVNARTSEKLSKATVHSTLREVKTFFEWLAREPGYRSHISFPDADYLSPNEKDVAIARARRERPFPSLEQVEAVLAAMPAANALERRDRALVAFTTITGARVDALRTFRLGNVNLTQGFVEQDARTVATKFAKTFRTYFMPVSDQAMAIVADWVRELRENHLRADGEALFPGTAMGLGEAGGFQPQGLARTGWNSTGPIREVFRRAFASAGLDYFNPHSFRFMLVHHAMKLPLSQLEMRAWSLNLGHTDMMTTFVSYGRMSVQRQGELVRNTKVVNSQNVAVDPALVAQVLAAIQTLPGDGIG